MNTPIADFVRRYAGESVARMHVPGHKGKPFLGCEPLDNTEICGADALYEASGIVAESEANASALFGSRCTCYSTEGSSHCIRAMLYLAVMYSGSHRVVAARNVHRAFVSAAALLDLDVTWLWPQNSSSLCSCPVSAGQLEDALKALPAPPAAVYITSPDYLGNMADISALAEICHRHKTLLLVDNAHGAYLRFLRPSRHPLDLGADLCCDSAHKTLPVLTGGAYLHVSRDAPAGVEGSAKEALALFGSTSPSYLTLASLDLCNLYLTENYSERLEETAGALQKVRDRLAEAGWHTEPCDPLRLTLAVPADGTGQALAAKLRCAGAECEYADRDFLVLMATPENRPEEMERVIEALGRCTAQPKRLSLPPVRGKQACSIRTAAFSPREIVPIACSLGRVCGLHSMGCPPAIPVAVAGERISAEMLAVFAHYDIRSIEVLRGDVKP